MLQLIPINLRVLTTMFRITFLSMLLLLLAQGATVAETTSAGSLSSEEMLELGEWNPGRKMLILLVLKSYGPISKEVKTKIVTIHHEVREGFNIRTQEA